MSEGRHPSPQEVVADAGRAEVTQSRPRQIVWVIRLAAIGYVTGVAESFISWEYYAKQQTLNSAIWSSLLSLGLGFWIYYKIYVGRNWARIALLVASILGLGVLLLSRSAREALIAGHAASKAQVVLGMVLTLVELWLLFVSSGRLWFSEQRRASLPSN